MFSIITFCIQIDKDIYINANNKQSFSIRTTTKTIKNPCERKNPPPRNLGLTIDFLPKAVFTPIKSSQDELKYQPSGFLDHLIQKYTTNTGSEYIDLASKVQKVKPIIFS